MRIKFQMMYEEGRYAQVPLNNFEELADRFLSNELQVESRPYTPPHRHSDGGVSHILMNGGTFPHCSPDYHEELATELIYYVRERVRKRKIPIKGILNMRLMTVSVWGWGKPFLLRTMGFKWRSPSLRKDFAF